MCKSNQSNRIRSYSSTHYRKQRKGKTWYFCRNRRTNVLFIPYRALYRNPASIYRSKRVQKTNSHLKIHRIADKFPNSFPQKR